MSKLTQSDEPKVNQCQIKSKAQISKILDFGLWHSFDICLPARSRFGEGRDF
jgi:hypothetical protein